MIPKNIKCPQIQTPKCRLSFPSLIEPTNYKGQGKLQYSVTLIFDDPAQLQEMKANAKGVVAQAFPNGVPDNFWSPFQKCESKSEKQYKGYEPGYIFLKAKAAQNVELALVSSNGKTKLKPEDFYGGCYVVADVHFWPYQEGTGCGLSVRLNGLQFAGNGERFSGRSVDFEDLGIEEGMLDEHSDAGGDNFL
jgi:hypothetical protein